MVRWCHWWTSDQWRHGDDVRRVTVRGEIVGRVIEIDGVVSRGHDDKRSVRVRVIEHAVVIADKAAVVRAEEVSAEAHVRHVSSVISRPQEAAENRTERS